MAPKRAKSKPADLNARIMSRWDAGIGVRVIAKEFGMSVNAIRGRMLTFLLNERDSKRIKGAQS